MKWLDCRTGWIVFAVIFFVWGTSVKAYHDRDIDLVGGMSQDQFRNQSEMLGTALSYPVDQTDVARQQGSWRFGYQFLYTYPQQNMDETFGGQEPDNIQARLLHGSLGLGGNMEAMGFVNGVSGNMHYTGGAYKWSINSSDYFYPIVATLLPTLSFRAHGTYLWGPDDLALSTYGGDVTVNFPFSPFQSMPLIARLFGVDSTSYLGYSRYRINAFPDPTNLSEEHFTAYKVYFGSRTEWGPVMFDWNISQSRDLAYNKLANHLAVNFHYTVP